MDLKIFTENIEPTALNQVYELLKQPAFAECKVRIMPDVHAGKGCVIGFTADLGDKVIPNIVGVDIGCGMLTTQLDAAKVDLVELDSVINKYVPSGRNVHGDTVRAFEDIKNLHCLLELGDLERINRSIGTLGGGNHFIELDTDARSNMYLIIHSGSRNLGKQVAEYYQSVAIEQMQGANELKNKQEHLIKELKASGKSKEIKKAVKELRRKFQPKKLGIPKELCYLTGEMRKSYLHDMGICQEYAKLNREVMADIIITKMGLKTVDQFHTVHNYIDLESNIVRKGAISAKEDERLLIPINMRDGCILGVGKGNSDWNHSAPHGAGRIMSRSAAKKSITLSEYTASMEGIHTTSVGTSTIDEAPMAYKPMEEIVRNIADTVEIQKIIKPVYNFKAGE